jgi:hypothetical protein
VEESTGDGKAPAKLNRLPPPMFAKPNLSGTFYGEGPRPLQTLGEIDVARDATIRIL